MQKKVFLIFYSDVSKLKTINLIIYKGEANKMNNRIRYSIKETYRNLFFQMPKFLFNDEFKDLSNDARILYCLLKDRHELSLANKWYDLNGDVFIIYTRKEMQDMLNLSENTIAKAMKHLKRFNLIQEEKQGLGKPNKIYLLTTADADLRLTRKICGLIIMI